MIQLLLHLFGDFVVQNDWMALNKKEPGWIGIKTCAIHSITYALPFLLITSIWAVLLIGITHYIIDRGHLVEKYIQWHNGETYSKNFGYGKDRPFAISIWLFIITDNTFHLIINFALIALL